MFDAYNILVTGKTGSNRTNLWKQLCYSVLLNKDYKFTIFDTYKTEFSNVINSDNVKLENNINEFNSRLLTIFKDIEFRKQNPSYIMPVHILIIENYWDFLSLIDSSLFLKILNEGPKVGVLIYATSIIIDGLDKQFIDGFNTHVISKNNFKNISKYLNYNEPIDNLDTSSIIFDKKNIQTTTNRSILFK